MRDRSVSPSSGSRGFHRATSASAVDLKSPDSPKEFGYLDQIEFLRQSLKDSNWSTDSLFSAVTETARVLAGADAAALALRQNGTIICRARSGSIGPELGSPVNTESGISGECLRSETTLVSSDTLQDVRVDPDVCRDLGIRSLAVVPLHGQSAVIGILEAFSGRPGTFESDQLVWLQALAEVAEQIYEREHHPQPTSVPVVSIRAQWLSAMATNSRRGVTVLRELFAKKDYGIFTAAGMVVLILSAATWLTLRKPRTQVAAGNDLRPGPASVVKADPVPAPRNVPHASAPRVTGNRSTGPSAGSLLQKAAQLSPAADPDSSRNPTGSSDQRMIVSRGTQPVAKQAVPDEPPPAVELIARNHVGTPLSAITTSPALPPYAGPISQVTEAKLIRKVEPFYPAQARLQRLQGSVVLDATIAADGTVRSTKVITGAPMLAQAASTAVRNWRYTAATLNGKPTEVVTRITIVFTLP